jgi:hypothetical protein
MPRNNPCHTCAGGTPCEECLNDPRNSTPVKLYTPKGAARAMLAGKTLKDSRGNKHFWYQAIEPGTRYPSIGGFAFKRTEGGKWFPVEDFGGLYEELT